MNKITTLKADDNLRETTGSYKIGSLDNVHFKDLVNMLGEPTLSGESGDGKVQFEWVLEHDNRLYTIYDWKTYHAEYTLNELTTWSVGGKEYIDNDFVTEIFRLCEENCPENVAESIMFYSGSGFK